jgi:hypothetical protein
MFDDDDEMFWEEVENEFDDYAASSGLDPEQLETEKRFAETVFGRKIG